MMYWLVKNYHALVVIKTKTKNAKLKFFVLTNLIEIKNNL